MSRLTEGELEQLGPWPAGANNLARETSVPSSSFREGVNIDVTDDGKVQRREGATLHLEAAEAESLFGYGTRGFFLQEGTLQGFEVSAGQLVGPIELAEGLARDVRAAHCMVDPDLYVSDGTVALRIAPDNSVAPWALNTPSPPTVAAAATGSLTAGRYYFAVTAMLPSGEESGLSLPSLVELDDTGGATLAIPTLAAPATRCAIYMTKPNGSEFLLLAVIPAGSPSITINKQALGRPCATEDLDPMPAGRFAAAWNGRLLVAVDALVYWSEPMHYSLTNVAYNYMVFSEDVTMLAAVDTGDGFFVGQGSTTYFVRGSDPAAASLKQAYTSGVVPGTLAYVPGSQLPMQNPPSQTVPVWMATNGVFCVGTPDGSVIPLSEARYAARTGYEGAAAFIQQRGTSRYVATVRNPVDNNFAVGDSISAEVVQPNP